MCGIAGCVTAPGAQPDRAALERAKDALHHRGPDGDGLEIVDSVGLVHTRLAIVDPSPAGSQPMRHPGGGWWLTYNGEIFNHLDLRAELPETDWRGGSDTETLLHALGAWGEDAIGRCNGLFAYAALDLERRRLLLVRDRFGVKPLYIARHEGAIWFASEMGALLAAGLPRRPRPDVLGHAIASGWSNGPPAPIDGIEHIMPGTLVSIDLDTLTQSTSTWYDPADVVDRERMASLSGTSRDDARELVGDALQLSVRRRLMADVPVGTMCSGGLDSSLVAALAAREHPRIVAYNAAVTDQPEVDESPFAEAVASRLGIDLRTVQMDTRSWCRDLVGVVRHIEYPLTHESSVPMAQIAGLARDDGVKVLLSGEGADELFGGYGWLHQSDFADFSARRRPLERPARALYRRLQALGFRPLPAGPTPPPEVAAYERGRRDRALEAYRFHRGPRRRLEAGLLEDLSVYLPHLLNRQDKSTMQRSVETRVPFLDPDLVALALNLPLPARLEPDRKAILREIGSDLLPEEVLRRPKIGFGFDAESYIVSRARPEFLAEGMLRDVLGVPAERWRATIQTADRQHALRLWTGEIWCRTLLGGESDGAVEQELWRD